MSRKNRKLPVPLPPGYTRRTYESDSASCDVCSVCLHTEESQTPPELRHDAPRATGYNRETHDLTAARNRRVREGWVPLWGSGLTEITLKSSVPVESSRPRSPWSSEPLRMTPGVRVEFEAGYNWCAVADAQEWVLNLEGEGRIHLEVCLAWAREALAAGWVGVQRSVHTLCRQRPAEEFSVWTEMGARR